MVPTILPRSFLSFTVLVLTSLVVNPVLGNEEIVQAIEKQALELPIANFEYDTTMIQNVDHVNKITTYRLPLLEQPTYIRDNTDDSSKDVLVLKDSDDKLAYKKNKRIYIVLRRKQAADYYVTAVSVRDAFAADKDLQKISSNGKEYIMEWLNFDHHLFPSKNNLMLRTYFCVYSYLAPCSFNASVLTPPEKFVKSSPFFSQPVDSESDKFITTDGSDAEDNYNFYSDLEIRATAAQSGRFVAAVVGAAVGGAFGIACGVIGAVFGFGASCNPAPETVIVHEQLPPVMVAAPPLDHGGMAAASAAAAAHYGRMAGGHAAAEPYAYPPVAPAFPASGSAFANYPGAQVVGRKKRNTVAAPEPQDDYPGWKTQFTVPTAESSLAHENEIFFGFGNCPSSSVDPKELDSATTDEQVTNFYLKVLRADCLVDRTILIPKLIADGAIIVENKQLRVNAKNQRFEHKMGLKGYLELSSAAELCALTGVYGEALKSHDPAKKFKTPDGQHNISRSINLITNFVYRYLSGVRSRGRIHMIQLTRNLVLVLDFIYDKLRQDQKNLIPCSDCTLAKEINANDRLQVLGLLEFVKYGLAAVDKGEEPQKTFADFFTKNIALLTKLS